MNNNVENSVEETFDDMLDSVKSINDDFINSYFENDKIDKILEENNENEEFYNEESLKDLSNELSKDLFDNEKNVENYVENLSNQEKEEQIEDQNEKISNKQDEITKEDIIDLIDQTNTSEEFFNILEGKIDD